MNLCASTITVTVSATANPLTNAGTDVAICNGSNTQLNASGATSYSWSPIIGLSNPAIANPIASPTVTTTYTLTASIGACFATDTVIVSVNQLPIISVTPAALSICAGISTSLTASGATTYSWSPSEGLNATVGATVIATPTSTSAYIVTGMDVNGCIDSTAISVTVHPLPVVFVSPVNPIICNGNSVNLTAIGSSTYSWSPASGLNATTGAIVTATPISTTTYTVIGTDTNGCSATSTVAVGIGSTPVADFNYTPVDLIVPATTVNFTDISAGNASIWSWNFGDPNSGVNNSASAQNPFHVYSDTGTYCIKLVISDVNGFCKDSTLHCLKVEQPFTFYIPNAFTPFNDGLNEFYTGFGTSIKEFNMIIFDRWGEKIWSCQTFGNPQADAKCSWDGKVKDREVQQDIYVWKVDLIDFEGKIHRYIGHLTLVK